MQAGAVETEIKLAITSRTQMQEKIREAGFQPTADRVFEANTLYDDAAHSLRARGVILRLRHAGPKFVITFKGPGTSGVHKSREEIETSVGSAEDMHCILARLGFLPVFRYEKYRTEYKRSNADPGVLTLDETPISDFLELEGPADWIDQTASLLGFTVSDYIVESYGKLYLTHCERLGLQPGNMVFSS